MMPVKSKICKACGQEFKPYSSLAKCCSPKCAIEYNKKQDKINAKKAFNAETKRLKQKLNDKDRKYWTKKSQAEFNKYIRVRDKNLPCVSCGRFHGGQYHAGHYRTTKAAPQLRFNELNCFKQCAPCNSHLSGNITEYRVGLIKRIGIKSVEWIESNQAYSGYTIDELKWIMGYYKEKTKLIENNCGHFEKWAEGLGDG